jgi:hypothetical protein
MNTMTENKSVLITGTFTAVVAYGNAIQNGFSHVNASG